MKLNFTPLKRHKTWLETPDSDWNDWRWQMRNSLKSEADFERIFDLTVNEREGLQASGRLFKSATTPYYASLAPIQIAQDPIRRIFMPHKSELILGAQQMLDPLGEKKNQATERIVHRYSDRVLFWVTDTCSVYCRYCTRKHFTAQGHAAAPKDEYTNALEYIRSKPGIREVILSGGDPLTLSDSHLDGILKDLRAIEHIEIIRVGSRMPVVNPMRMTSELVSILRRAQPVFFMTHFNHPRELTKESFEALARLVDNGIPVLNQMVLLNGVNNHAAIVQALSRRLLYARVKPYYMFQCDPSQGTDHLRTSVENSLNIQREMWGHLSGIAMPTLSLDIPEGGGKTTLVPNFQTAQDSERRSYKGWDGVQADYISPTEDKILSPLDTEIYLSEWENLKRARAEQI